MNRMKHLFIKILLLSISISFLNCKKNDEKEPDTFLSTSDESISNNDTITLHKDTTYKYEYRTGNSGDYEYNYDVSGYDKNNLKIEGNASMNGKYGTGYFSNPDGEKIQIDVEWIDYGVLKAIDNDGNEYELTVD